MIPGIAIHFVIIIPLINEHVFNDEYAKQII